jgi:hypothetical protein
MMNGIGIQIPGFQPLPTVNQQPQQPMQQMGPRAAMAGVRQPMAPQPMQMQNTFMTGMAGYASGQNTFLETALNSVHAAGSIDKGELNRLMNGVKQIEGTSGYTLIAPGEEGKAPFLTLIGQLNAFYACLVDDVRDAQGNVIQSGYLSSWLPNSPEWSTIRTNTAKLASLLLDYKKRIKEVAGITDNI